MNKSNVPNSDHTEDVIDLKVLFGVLWNGKWLLLSSILIFSIIFIIYSLSLPNIYKSSALLSPVGDQSSSARSYIDIANFAGLNLPQSSISNSVKAKDKLNSLSFFKENIMPNIFLPDLMAVKSWDPKTNSISYNEGKYNQNTNTWVRDFEYPQTQIPSAQESFEVFKSFLEVSEDKKGFITISFKHHSPFIAQEIIDLIVKELNYFFRVKDKAEALAAVDYLNLQMRETSVSEIKQVIAQLLQQKTQQLALLEVSEFYVFEYIDPPAVMENKYGPKRSIICILGAFLGGIFGVIIIAIRHFIRSSSTSLTPSN